MNELIQQIENAQNEREFRRIIAGPDAANIIFCEGNSLEPLLGATTNAVTRFATIPGNETSQQADNRRVFTLGLVGDFLSCLPAKITDANDDVKSYIKNYLSRTQLSEQLLELAGRDVSGLRRGTEARESIERARRTCQNFNIPRSTPVSNFSFFTQLGLRFSLSNQDNTRNENQLKEWGFEESQLDTEALKETYREILCPLSWQVMDDPVKISSGKVYDRSFLKNYLKKLKPHSLDNDGRTSWDNNGMAPCPMTTLRFQPEEADAPTDNEKLKDIQSFMEAMGEKRKNNSIQMK